MENTSIILCSGAWHAQAHIDPVIPYFTKAGYKIIPQTLPSAGPALRTWLDDVKAIQSTTLAELKAGHQVVLILHSLAGLAGLEAINQITERPQEFSETIKHIILVGSFINMDPVTEVLLTNNFMQVDAEKGLLHISRGEVGFYNDISLEQAQPFIDALTTQALFRDPPKLSSERWRKAAKLTYLLCNQDNVVLPEIGERKAEEFGMQVVRMDAGHCPFTTQPERFMEVVDGILRG